MVEEEFLPPGENDHPWFPEVILKSIECTHGTSTVRIVCSNIDDDIVYEEEYKYPFSLDS